ncbi:hypothetical protein B0H17DRAFT_1141327 [Mycena rosella]|uniref:Uncharacterized protein n=1 Tax=Mycena rosella TaxID=1033263 RepID=A0AAD7D150_MYCRO|nr:hypothetical protein B0H17DRAFT_1141327 [Mycena rosella]
MEPDNPNHKNPALTAVLNLVLPHIAEILAEFNYDHLVIKKFNEHFAGKKEIQRHRGTGEWMANVGLGPTPELEVVLMAPFGTLLTHDGAWGAVKPQRRLAGGPPRCAVAPCPSNGAKALEAMFDVICVPSGKAAVWFKQMMEFNRDHTIYDTQFRPPKFRRDDPSFSAPTEAIPVIVKRPGEQPNKRAKAGILRNELKAKTPGHSRSPSTQAQKLRSGKTV